MLEPSVSDDDQLMTTHLSATSTIAATWNRRRYLVITGLLCTIFVVSFGLTVFDPTGTRVGTERLGFPVYIALYPLAFAKLAAVIVILSRRCPTLRIFAFAGLLFDMVLALMAHIHEGDFPYGWFAVFGLVVWCAAFAVERERTAAESAV